MTLKQAADGWGVSVSTAFRMIKKFEAERGRVALESLPGMKRNTRIRTVDFLAVPRGETESFPVVPEIAILTEKLEAMYAQQEKTVALLGAVCRRLRKAGLW
jgi:hypothetical protein